VTRREGKALACKLYRVEEGRALYAGVLKAAAVGSARATGRECLTSSAAV
jgi:hypothetical protein